MPDTSVVRKTPLLTHVRAKELTADGVRDAVKTHGKDLLARAGDCSIRVIEKWMAEGSLPDLDVMLNLARQAPEVLTPILAEMGWNALTPTRAEPANDMALVAGMSATVAEFLRLLTDGKRCHVDTAILADLFRTLIPQMQAIVDEDDRMQGRAA